MMLCDCFAITVMEKRKFSKENFFLFHKGGNLGTSLRLAKDIMVSGNKMPIIDHKKKLSGINSIEYEMTKHWTKRKEKTTFAHAEAKNR